MSERLATEEDLWSSALAEETAHIAQHIEAAFDAQDDAADRAIFKRLTELEMGVLSHLCAIEGMRAAMKLRRGMDPKPGLEGVIEIIRRNSGPWTPASGGDGLEPGGRTR